MDKDTGPTNLETLRDMILDEQKLVTYVSLSKELCIHVNDSKQLLTKFVKDIRNRQADANLNISYILSGVTKDNKARITVTSEEKIAEILNTFKTVSFQHIYSVSKGLSDVDNVALLAVNKLEDLSLCTGLIKSNACVKRSSREIGNLKSSSQVLVKNEKKAVTLPQKKINDEKKELFENNLKEEPTVIKLQESKSEPNIIKKAPSPKKDSSNNAKLKSDNKNGTKSQKGIAGFFAKSNSAPSTSISQNTDRSHGVPAKRTKEVVNQPSQIKEEKMDTDIVCEFDYEENVSESKNISNGAKSMTSKLEKVKPYLKENKEVKTEVKKEPMNGKLKNKSLSDIKKTAKLDKKRKRVLHVSDSESEEDKDPFADEQIDSEDEIPPTPVANTVKITSGMINPKKRRKIVDKTYTDEEGYILTKKEEIYESCSDNEEDNAQNNAKENNQAPSMNHAKKEKSPIEKKKNPKNSVKKIPPPQKGKQATLMNFFKKV